METTVEGFCNAMARCQFLPPERIRDLRQRWLQEAGRTSTSLEQFTDWLICRHVVTEYQAGVIGRGNGDQLYIGPYRIVERIGKGRMAGVYKATHASGAIVAVKVLPPSKASQPTVFARFQREVKLALSVKHPNVVRTYHSGEHKSLHYLVMEHLEGETLDEVLARPKRLQVGEAVTLLHQALLGLQAIHAQGLVHRDLKPGNLMLIGGQPHSTLGAVVKILDLGEGRALFDDPDGSPQFDLTRPGEMLGSSDYMAPEQAKDAHNIDIRADIYSLGCVLYHALAGQPPFADVSPVRQLLRHATETPRPITEHNPEAPSGLQQVLNWMLAKDPGQRYPTPARAAQALEMFVVANSGPAQPKDTRLNTYLEWVDTLDGSASAAPAKKAAAVPSPPSKPPVPVVEVELVSLPADDIPTIQPSKPAPVPPPPPPPAKAPRPPRDHDEEEEEDRPRSRKKPPREEKTPAPRRKKASEDEEEEESEPERLMGMRPREMMVLTISLLAIIGLGVVGLLGWLVHRALS
jgi:serine/threonine protein kinase